MWRHRRLVGEQPDNKAAVQGWCEQVRTYEAKYTALQDSTAGPDQQRSHDALAAMQTVQADAPAQASADIDVLATTLQHTLTAWRQASYSIDVIDNPGSVLTPSEVKALKNAPGHLQSFVSANC